MKVILEFDGSKENFERAFDSLDNYFCINDSVFWAIDYGEGAISTHHTKHGDIKIKVEE